MGESEKLVEATFTLARKLALGIFIDEIDIGFPARWKRARLKSGLIATMQGTLLSEWDGMYREYRKQRCVVLGATNRPMDLDAAILGIRPNKDEDA